MGVTLSKLDDTDREIISILRADARTPVATLAHKLRVSRGTVQNRLHKMEESGVIQGYTVRLRPDSEPQRIRAWMSIAVEGNAAPEIIRALRGEPMVGTLHTTNGRWDLVAEISCESLAAFDAALGTIRGLDGIRDSETSILLSSATA